MTVPTPTHSCCPNGSQPLDGSQPLNLTPSTASTASLSGNLTLVEVNVDAVNVFQPVGHSSVPTDICLVGLNDNLVDEFDAPLHNPSDSLTHPVNFDDAPCDTADPCDWHDNNINKACALVNKGAMVTCTGQ